MFTLRAMLFYVFAPRRYHVHVLLLMLMPFRADVSLFRRSLFDPFRCHARHASFAMLILIRHAFSPLFFAIIFA